MHEKLSNITNNIRRAGSAVNFMKNSNSNLENKSPEATKETFYKSTSMWKSTYNNSNEN